jgi:integrase
VVPEDSVGRQGDHGVALDEDEIRTVVEGFRKGFRDEASVFYPIVAVGALTAARRGEVLALRWTDLDVTNKTLSIRRALEQTEEHGIRFKEPKNARSKRTFHIDDGLLALLLAEREKHLRFHAGIPDDVEVDLSLVKLPDDALMFPNSPARGEKVLADEAAQSAQYEPA